MSDPILKKIQKHLDWMDLREGNKAYSASTGNLVGIVVKDKEGKLVECSSVDLGEFCKQCSLSECVVKRERV